MAKLKFLLSCFGSFQDIYPNPDNYTYFIDKFRFLGNVLPNIIQEVPINGKPIDRLNMRTSDDSWNISFLTNRVNIEWNNKFIKELTLGDFLSISRTIIDVIFEKTDSKFNRIGLVTTCLHDIKDKDLLNSLYYKFNVPNEIFGVTSPIEWNNRSVFKVVEKFEDGNETLNIVNEVKRIQGSIVKSGKSEPFEGIEVMLDLNTHINNKTHRFDKPKTNSFLDLLFQKETSLQTAFNQMLNG